MWYATGAFSHNSLNRPSLFFSSIVLSSIFCSRFSFSWRRANSKSFLSVISLTTASNLGLEAIKKKTRAYLGYTALLTSVSFANTVKNFPVPTMANASPSEKVILDAQEDFIECVNSYNIALLEGMTYKDAWKIGDETYAKKWNKWKSMCVPPEKRTDFGKKICPWLKDTFNQNRMIFVRLGIPIAVARPIGIVINP